jgi:integrase
MSKSSSTTPKSNFTQVGENLQRYVPSGTYYARIRVAGKLHKKSLETTVITVAKLKLADFAKKLRTLAERQKEAGQTRHGDLTVGGAIAAFLEETNKNLELKPRTKSYHAEVVKAIGKTWPGLDEREVRSISQKECKAWANRLRKHGTGFQAKGTKAPRKGISSSRYNACLDILRRIFAPTVKEGIRYENPADDLPRATVRLKHLVLPSPAQFKKMVKVIEGGKSRDSRAAADMVRFLAYSGCRISEAIRVLFSHINWDKGEITIMGDPETGTKNWEHRTIPLLKPMREMLERMRLDRGDCHGHNPVLLVRECQKSLDRAAKLVGVARITHHDLRHLFTTTCIESAVDIPTVARWLGHRDGGALLMKRYIHLRPEHSKKSAELVTFD